LSGLTVRHLLTSDFWSDSNKHSKHFLHLECPVS